MSERPKAQGTPSGIQPGDLSGHTLGDYRIDSLLGRGGCGSVYLAQDIPLDRSVAVKVLGGSQSPAVSDQSVDRFMREARAIASVDHPNIVQIHRVAKEGDICYIVMQHVKGQTLSRRIRDADPISIADAVLIALQVSSALEAAHRIDLVHRDIKPSNVMIDPEGQVKVMDFGLARTSSPDTAITHTGMFVGTPRYSSPEQCETSTIDCRSDLYSLGVILYEMLAGKVPHEADTPLALMNKIVHEPPAPLEELNADVPADLIEIVTRLLEKSCEDRYSSATELSNDLRKVLERMKNDSAQPFEPTIQIPTESRRRQTSGRAAIVLKAAAAVLILAAVAVGIWLAYPKAKPVPPGGIGGTPAVTPPAAITGSAAMVVYDFTNATKDPELDWLTLGVPDMLSASLTQFNYIQLKTRDQILWSVDPRPERLDDRLLAKLNELKIDVVVKGTVYREGENLRFVVHIHELAKRKNIKSIVRKGTTESIFATIDALAGDITAGVSEFLMSQDRSGPALAAKLKETGDQAFVPTWQVQSIRFTSDYADSSEVPEADAAEVEEDGRYDDVDKLQAKVDEPGRRREAETKKKNDTEAKKGIVNSATELGPPKKASPKPAATPAGTVRAGGVTDEKGKKTEPAKDLDRDEIAGDPDGKEERNQFRYKNLATLKDHVKSPRVIGQDFGPGSVLAKEAVAKRRSIRKDRQVLVKQLSFYYKGKGFLNTQKLSRETHKRELETLRKALNSAEPGEGQKGYTDVLSAWQKEVQKRASKK